jgi:hypothetical protein
MMFFRDRLPKKKMHLVGMSNVLILLSLGSGYHITLVIGGEFRSKIFTNLLGNNLVPI